MDYNEQIKQRLSEASEEAKRILQAVMEAEKPHRWQSDHKRLTSQVVEVISEKVKGIVK